MKKIILILAIFMPFFCMAKSDSQQKTLDEIESALAYSIIEINANLGNMKEIRSRLIDHLEKLRELESDDKNKKL